MLGLDVSFLLVRDDMCARWKVKRGLHECLTLKSFQANFLPIYPLGHRVSLISSTGITRVLIPLFVANDRVLWDVLAIEPRIMVMCDVVFLEIVTRIIV